MLKPIIKICGLSTPETIETAIVANVDWIGLVTFTPSPRHVEPSEGGALAALVRGSAKVVSLTVDAHDDLLDAINEHIKPDIFQLQGKETPDRVASVKERFRRPVMKAIGISSIEDLAKIEPYQGVADYLLLDAKPPKDAKLPGGNGKTFDWSILDHLPEGVDFMLAGGLNPENVADAIRSTQAFGVDVSSGVERAPGQKDTAKMKAFIRAAKEAGDNR